MQLILKFTLFGMRSFSDHLLNKPNVCLCLKSSSLFSETQTTLSFRFGHSNCFQSTSWYIPWLVKMRVCHITAVVPDDLLHAPTQKSFPIALQLSIGRPVNSAELHQLLTPSLSARMNAAFQIAAQHWTICSMSIHPQQCTNCKTPQSLGLSHFHGILNEVWFHFAQEGSRAAHLSGHPLCFYFCLSVFGFVLLNRSVGL